MATRIKLRRDTAANWLEANPILANGETGFETDTRMMKLGDGATRWADLKYAVTGDLQVSGDTIHGDTSVSLSSGVGSSDNWIVLTNPNDGGPSNPEDAISQGVAYDSLGNAFSMGSYYNQYGTFLQKISPTGEVIWNNFYSEYASYGFGMATDKDDNVVMILSEEDASSNDLVLVKVSGEDGSIMWQKYLSSYGDYDDYASCIDIDANGNIIISGRANNAGPDNNNLAYVAKFSGANGSMIWSKSYDIQGFDSNGTGLAVDPDGNIGIVGSASGDYTFIAVYKLDGSDGSVLWQSKILNIKWDNGNTFAPWGDPNGELQSSDIAADSAGNFYFTFNWYAPFSQDSMTAVIKLNGEDGLTAWARQLSWPEYRNGAGSVICDSLNNVYVSNTLLKYKSDYDQDYTYRTTQNITKINATGSVVWQRWLTQEQAETFDGKLSFYNNNDVIGQSIAVKGDYVLVGGNYVFQYYYNDDDSDWIYQPYAAQLNTNGTEFDVSGWKFVDSSNDTPNTFISVIRDDNEWIYEPASVQDFDVNVNSGDVTYEQNTDTTDLVYVNTSRVNKVTFAEKTLSLPAGGAVELSREKLGYITAIGNFDGNEGGNTDGDVWLNGSARDEKGATYAAGAWYNDTGDDWNNSDSYVSVPLVFKTDSNGKLIWQAGSALDQWGDLVDVVYQQSANAVVVLGNDGELDGTEGFNIMYLDADTGNMKQDITHVRPANNDNDIYPTGLRVMSDGTPVVTGYVTSAADTYADVTSGGAGLPGSTNNGTLVVSKSVFVREGFETVYPEEDSTWYLDGSSQIYSVNRFGYVGDGDSVLEPVYTGTTGTNATVDITISGAVVTAAAVNAGGSGYKVGHSLLISGADLGGTTGTNDLTVYVSAVDGSGAITALDSSYSYGTLIDGIYTGVATTAVVGTGFEGWVQYSTTGTEYTFNFYSGGNYFGEGDTFTVSGALLGGTTGTNDLTITVTAINGSGYGNGIITAISTTGTAQTATIKLYGGGTDYTVTGTWSIVHELNNDGFIWTPTWDITFGSANGNVYDDFHGVALDSSDNIIVTGYSDNTGLSNSGYGWSQTGVITKFSSTGTHQWTVSIDGSEGGSTVWGAVTDTDDNIYSVMDSGANDDLYVTKLSSTGTLVWQQSFDIWNSNTWAIDITDNGDILIAGSNYIQQNQNDYHKYDNGIVIIKLDKDGNKLFSRLLWSTNGIDNNYNDNYSNHLTVKGDRFSVVAYSRDPGDDNQQGIVVDLPIDGTGLGQYGNFTYEEIEMDVSRRYNDNGHWDGLVTPISLTVRPHEFTEAPYIDDNAWRNITIYADRQHKVQTVRKAGGAEVKGVAKITFEDGSVQTTSMQGLPQVDVSLLSNGNYWLRPEDNGKHVLMKWGNTVIIPSPNRLELPIGYAVTIINGGWYGDCGVWSEDYDEDIYLAGGDGDNDNSWSIPQWTVATLIKIEDGRWMIMGTNLSSGWW